MITPDHISTNDSVSTSVDRDLAVRRSGSRLPYVSTKSKLLLISVLIIAAAVYLTLIRPYSFGSYHDDGMYAVLAKSLASGQGYRVISLPSEPQQTKSPPLYPFLLSVIWRVLPNFPQNVPVLMFLSIVASIGFLFIAWRYLTDHGYATPVQALIVIGAAALNWRTILLSTGVYSEMLYGLLSVIALGLAERQEKKGISLLASSCFGVLMGLAFLTRSSAIALPVAFILYCVVRRQWRRLLVPVLVCGIFVGSWLLWGYLHKPPTDSVNAGYYESYLSTLGQVFGGTERRSISSILSSLLELVAVNAIGLVVVTIPVICLGLSFGSQGLPGFVFAIGVCLFAMTLIFTIGGFFRFRETGFRLLHAYVAVYLLVHIFWPYAAYDRFLMPLLPWFLLFLIIETSRWFTLARKGFASGAEISKKIVASLIGALLMLMCGVIGYNIVTGILMLHDSAKAKIRFAEDQEAIHWLAANASASDVVICYRDPTYFLHTGLKAIRSISAREGGLTKNSGGTPEEQVRIIFQIIKESKAKYLVATSTDYEQEDQAELQREALKTLIQQNPDQFVTVFESAEGESRIYQLKNHEP